MTAPKASNIEASRDRPDNETGVPQIEVTPEMIEAGVAQYEELVGEATPAYVVGEVVSALLRTGGISVRFPEPDK